MFKPNYNTCIKCLKHTLIVVKKGLCKLCNSANKKTKQYVYKRKPTGERNLFLDIWNERPHFCKHCNINLGNEPKTFFFSHIKPKSTHPELRLSKDNIQLLCYQCHYNFDFR